MAGRILSNRLSYLSSLKRSLIPNTFAKFSARSLVRNAGNDINISDEDVEIVKHMDHYDGIEEGSTREDLLANTSFTSPSSPNMRVTSSAARRPWAVTADDKFVRVRMDMPGLTKDDVKVYVDNGILVIRGYPTFLEEEAGENGEVDDDDEDSSINYEAELLLPDNVQKDQIRAQIKHGVLLVTAPKEVVQVLVE